MTEPTIDEIRVRYTRQNRTVIMGSEESRTIVRLCDEIVRLCDEIDRLCDEIDRLCDEIDRLRSENNGLRERINQILGGSIGVP